MANPVTLAVSAAALAMLLIASVLPWLAVNLQGQFSYNLIDVVRGLTSREAVDPAGFRNGDFASFTTTYRDIYVIFAFSVIFYVSAIIYLVGSVVSANKRKAALGPGGILAIAATVAWIFGIEMMKTHVLVDSRSDGPFADFAAGFINSVFNAGAGAYLVLAAGIIALAYYFMKERTIERTRYQGNEEESTYEEESDIESDKPANHEQHRAEEETVRRSANISRIVYKSSGTAALLAFVGAIFGLPGIGHIYVGRIGRGLLILASGFVLYIFSWLSLLGGVFGGIFGGNQAGLQMFQAGASTAFVFILMYFGLLIWHIFDARSLAKKLNEHVQLTGKELW